MLCSYRCFTHRPLSSLRLYRVTVNVEDVMLGVRNNPSLVNPQHHTRTLTNCNCTQQFPTNSSVPNCRRVLSQSIENSARRVSAETQHRVHNPPTHSHRDSTQW